MKSLSYLQRFGDVELAVRQCGEGLPLVWGHGLLGSMIVDDKAGLFDWDAIEQQARVIRYDARGHGNSDGSYKAEDYHWEHMAADMLAVAEAIAGPGADSRYVLGGISMGAATALQAALQHPERVAGLILALPPTAWNTRPPQARKYRRMSFVSKMFGAVPYRLLSWLPTPTSDSGLRRLSHYTVKGLARANPLYVDAALFGASISDLPDRSVLKELDIPTLILGWEGDSVHPVSTVHSLREILPRLHGVEISKAGDASSWTPRITEFLQALGSRRRGKSSRAVTKKRSSAE
jgi:pimeloyl-ACP methyl ester carboxylesterase